MQLTSSAFEDGRRIPDEYTCDGTDVSPVLSWSELPENARYIAIVNEDPDAPMGTWIHWLIFDVPAEPGTIGRGLPAQATLAGGAGQGMNSWGNLGYGGPCPPSGNHRYYFTAYAYAEPLGLDAPPTKDDLIAALKGRILEKAALMGTYSRRL